MSVSRGFRSLVRELDEVHPRTNLLLAGDDECFSYRLVAELAHAIDEVVVSEIENWEAVFGGKSVTVPA